MAKMSPRGACDIQRRLDQTHRADVISLNAMSEARGVTNVANILEPFESTRQAGITQR